MQIVSENYFQTNALHEGTPPEMIVKFPVALEIETDGHNRFSMNDAIL
jgi:hypothetical protein